METRSGLELKSCSRISNMLISVTMDSHFQENSIPFFLSHALEIPLTREKSQPLSRVKLSSTKINGKKSVDLDRVRTSLEQLEFPSL